ncbi:TonB-linked outer membrane protein, SusC/RagA family [Mucilaginibacter mallensis]|uniref:TonB-linked outer membrane protein, SusC/RagA family n=1 Tax=Mucilaginibacter mallensis TaxID=652787 RepID=A0A1H2BQY7_MUCMA|nr:SusC/RagA family TonB-linked outer membrane protein [Mucilaginibacter mallensis]SDT60715.1 TonB-linked outer membrane protein, SusC/RagA family [Mucilaginibacter mallensis]
MKKLLLVSLCFLMLSITQVFAQNRTVTGTVTAKDDGLPIPGVTVRVKGSTGGVVTNSAGKYSISAPAGATLQFSFIGYNALAVAPKGGVQNVSLEPASTQLGEVVVTGALGVKKEAKELGYSVATISTKELTQAKVTDVATGLAGKVSGLQVNLADNGVDPQVRVVLRGNRSITGNNQALIVVDGVPIDDPNYLNTINPEDIESTTVLKGATAAAIYGSKASNGVLIITTKHGSKVAPSITVSNTTYLQQLSYLPKLQNQFGGYGGEGGSYVNANGTVNPVGYENEAYGPAFDGRQLLIALSPIFAADGTTVTGYDSLYSPYTYKKNAVKDFFKTGLQNQFNVSYSAGTDHGTFYLGFQDATTDGIVPDDHSRRDNITISGNQDYGNFHADYKVSYDQNNVNVAGNSYNQATTSGGLESAGVFSGRPLYFEIINTPPNIPLEDFKDPTSQYGNPNSYYSAYSTNPYWTIANSRRKRDTYDLLGTLNLAYKITPWLSIADRIGITQTTEQFKYTRAGITFAPWAIADPQSAGNVPSSQGYLAPSEFDETYFEQRLNNDLYATFNKKFGDFSVNGLVGYNMEQRYQRGIQLQGDALQFPNDYNIGSVLGVPDYAEFSYTQRDYSFYEQATVGYKDFLYLTGTNRDEWNSVLAAGHDHFEYPSVNASYIFTNNIKALKDNKVLSYGKLTAAYSKVANINIGGTNGNPYGAYSLINPFVPPTGYPYGSIGGYSQSTLYLNPDIQPEKTTEYEFGTELGFLDGRISLKADYYQSKTRNESLTADVSAATGFTQKLVNAGLVTNTGEEFDLNVIAIKSRSVTWDIGATYSHYHNLINQLPGGEVQLSSFSDGVGGGIYAIQGQSFPVIKTNDWTRDPATGKVIVDPTTGRPTVDPTEKTYGNTTPTQILGLTNSISYKNFTFSFVLDYRGGYSIMNDIGAYLNFTGIGAQSAENGRQRFIFPNSVVSQGGKYVTNTSVAVNNGGNIAGDGFWPLVYGSNLGSIYVTSAAFWKVREANLTYDVPKSFLASNLPFIKRASVSLIGRNLLMFTPKSNIYTDPEFSESGNGNAVGATSDGQLPPTRFYGANLTVTF